MSRTRVSGVGTARKLLVGFGIGLAFITVCSVTALISLTALNAVVRHLAFDPVPGAAAIASFAKDFNQYRVIQLSSTTSADARDASLALKAVDITRDLKAYDDTITQEYDRGQFTELTGRWTRYRELRDAAAVQQASEEIDGLLAAMIEWNRLEGARSIGRADSATRVVTATVLSMLIAALLLFGLAYYINAALEESREQLQRLAAGLLQAREEERTKIAREIHDTLGQTLTALKMDVAWVGRRLPADAPSTVAKLAAMVTLIDDTVVTVRRIATDLRPGVLDDLGLAAAIEWQAQDFALRTGIRCELGAEVDDRALDPLVSTAVFRIFQESLTNVTRHSRASHVVVTLAHTNTILSLEVRDNGVGIPTADTSNVRSIGLTGMRERAQLVGGTFAITGAAGAGTTVRVRVPLPQGQHG